MGIPGPMSCPGGGYLWSQVPWGGGVPSGVGGCVGQWGEGVGRSGGVPTPPLMTPSGSHHTYS